MYILQYRHAICQPAHASTGDVSTISIPDSAQQPPLLERSFEPVKGAAQHIDHTRSRRTGPRRWLRAVRWMLEAGLHPRACKTTLRLAEDLAARMDYSSGHARYCLQETAARLGIDVSTVKRHASVLRELGLLAWVEHGTRANIRRVLGLGGYAGTATVYAAVIPPVYDQAMGYQVIGSGYSARIVVDLRKPVDNPAAGACAPPSLNVVKQDGPVDVDGGLKDTSRKRASRRTPTIPQQRKASSGRPARQVEQDVRITRQVRPLVPWTQHEGLRPLAHALRPLIDQGLPAHDIAATLTGWFLNWRPNRPAAYIRARLAQQQTLEAEHAAAVAPEDSAEWVAWCAQQRATEDSAQPLRTDADRALAREYGWADLAQVAEHYTDDPDDALDLYGDVLCTRAIRLAASAHASIGMGALPYGARHMSGWG